MIELLIVIAIVLLLAAIAIPNLLQGRMAANEASAAASVAQINTAQAAYSSAYPDAGFATNLAQLSGDASACGSSANKATSTQACLLDSVLGSGRKSGYAFSLSGSADLPNLSYSVYADPIQRGLTGQLSFYSDQSGVIRANTGSPIGGGGGSMSKNKARRRGGSASASSQSQAPEVSVAR